MSLDERAVLPPCTPELWHWGQRGCKAFVRLHPNTGTSRGGFPALLPEINGEQGAFPALLPEIHGEQAEIHWAGAEAVQELDGAAVSGKGKEGLWLLGEQGGAPAPGWAWVLCLLVWVQQCCWYWTPQCSSSQTLSALWDQRHCKCFPCES